MRASKRYVNISHGWFLNDGCYVNRLYLAESRQAMGVNGGGVGHGEADVGHVEVGEEPGDEGAGAEDVPGE